MPASGALKHIRNYASAGMLIAVASFVTFPLLTRALTVGEYGVLGLITASLTFFIAVGKLGLQHAVIRFYAQIKNTNLKFSLEQMNSTVFMLFTVFAIATTALWLLVGLVFIAKSHRFSRTYPGFLSLHRASYSCVCLAVAF